MSTVYTSDVSLKQLKPTCFLGTWTRADRGKSFFDQWPFRSESAIWIFAPDSSPTQCLLCSPAAMFPTEGANQDPEVFRFAISLIREIHVSGSPLPVLRMCIKQVVRKSYCSLSRRFTYQWSYQKIGLIVSKSCMLMWLLIGVSQIQTNIHWSVSTS